LTQPVANDGLFCVQNQTSEAEDKLYRTLDAQPSFSSRRDALMPKYWAELTGSH